MKNLITAEIEGSKLTLLIEVNNEGFAFPTYFINGDEIGGLDNLKPIFKAAFTMLVAITCKARGLKLYRAEKAIEPNF